MQSARSAASGKGSGDENFPVASQLIARRHRGPILAFYDFVRAADDVADHPTLEPAQKLRLLDGLQASLDGAASDEPTGVRLRSVLADRGLSPRHAHDLLNAFRQDVTKLRYESWSELIEYCRLSAMPVGRFVLDVHGESATLWPLNDALCAALQIINHLQDCGKDYRALDRVYLPLESMRETGAQVGDLGGRHAPPALRDCIARLASRTSALLDDAAPFAMGIRDLRLSLEVAAIHGLAQRLCVILRNRDPLTEETHLGKGAALGIAGLAFGRAAVKRIAGGRRRPQPA